MAYLAILWAPLLLALGLAMDATAVAVVRGLAVERVRPRDALRIALLFGGFQSGMSAIGWLIGDRAGPLVQRWDHWIAFGLLGAIGGKMIVEALRGGPEDEGAATEPDPFAVRRLLPLAIATSIDALAAGITLPLLAAPVWLSLVLIGGVAALLSAAGARLGKQIGARAGGKLDLIGGVVLIGIGTKILIEHLGA
jgi:manganese efflux pump family protein